MTELMNRTSVRGRLKVTCRRFPPQGGRRVLYLYGYTNQQIDGLSFPDDVSEPTKEKVAAVTLEVMVLRTEVDMLIKVGLCFLAAMLRLSVSVLLVCFISDISVCVGHPSSPRILQRHHPISHPAGLYQLLPSKLRPHDISRKTNTGQTNAFLQQLRIYIFEHDSVV